MKDFSPIQVTDDGILVAIERHWLTQSERQVRQLERAMHACEASDVRLDEDGNAYLTAEQWRRFTSSMVIQQAIDEVLRGC